MTPKTIHALWQIALLLGLSGALSYSHADSLTPVQKALRQGLALALVLISLDKLYMSNKVVSETVEDFKNTFKRESP